MVELELALYHSWGRASAISRIIAKLELYYVVAGLDVKLYCGWARAKAVSWLDTVLPPSVSLLMNYSLGGGNCAKLGYSFHSELLKHCWRDVSISFIVLAW